MAFGNALLPFAAVHQTVIQRTDLPCPGSYIGPVKHNGPGSAHNSRRGRKGKLTVAHKITMYSTGWCGDCRNAKRFLTQHRVAFEEVDIDAHPAAAQQVVDWSGGRRVVPTFLITSEDAGTRVILHNPQHPALGRAIGITV